MDCRVIRDLPVLSVDLYQHGGSAAIRSEDLHKDTRALQRTLRDAGDESNEMKTTDGICSLLVCCSALWIVSCSSSRVEAPPSPPPPPLPSICDSRLVFSSEIPSWSERNGDTNVRSLSPWTWRSSTEKNRIPSTIFEAECSSSFCVLPNRAQTDGHSLNSVPIYQNILVLRRQGRHCYKATYQRVAVGCTCVGAQSKEQGTS